MHALGQVANFKIETDMAPQEIMRYMNRYLPEDIQVVDICEMPDRFHGILNAKRRPMYIAYGIRRFLVSLSEDMCMAGRKTGYSGNGKRGGAPCGEA